MQTAKARPAGIWVIGIVAVILGPLGGCAGIWGIATPLFQDRIMETQRQMVERTSTSSGQAHAQLAMQDRLLEVQRRWRTPTLIHQGLNLFASLALLGAGIMLLTWREAAPMLAIGAAAANAVVDLGSAVLKAMLQIDTASAVQASMSEITHNTPGSSPELDRVMDSTMTASMMMGMCWTMGITLLFVGYYVFTIIYLRKPAVRALFASGGAEPPAAF